MVPIPISFLRECFTHDAAAGVLRWRTERPASHFKRARRDGWVPVAGMPAGHINSKGYLLVSVRHEGRDYRLSVHRILWALEYNEWPKRVLDHINRVRTDNRICNLRDVSVAVNAMNRTRRQGQSAGTTGVRERGGRYAAYINNSGRQRHLGTFDTQRQAHAAYLAEAARVYGETFTTIVGESSNANLAKVAA